MKKLILASAIAAVAATTSASAFTLYDKGDFKFKLKGDLQIQYQQDIGDDEDLELVYDDLEIKFEAEYKLGNGLTALGRLDFDAANDDGEADDAETDNAYVGLKSGGLKVTIGQQDYISDDFGVTKDIEFGFEDVFGEDFGDETIKIDYDAGAYTIGFTHDIDTSVDVLVTSTFGNVAVGLAYQDIDSDFEVEPGEEAPEDTFGVQASIDVGPSNIGIDYSTNDDVDAINIAADYTSGQTVFAAGVTRVEFDDSAEDDETLWYLNTTYKLHKHVSVFAEIGDSDADDNDLGYLAGMKVKF